MVATELRVAGHPSVDELAAALVVLSSCRAADAGPAEGHSGFAARWRAGRRAALGVVEPDDRGQPTSR